MKTTLKKFFLVIAIILGILVGYKLTALLYPKNLNRYPFFLLLILMDVYLFAKCKGVFDAKSCKKRFWVGFASFLPSFILIMALILGYFFPPTEWNEPFRIFLFGFIFALYTAQFLSVLLLLILDVIRLFRRGEIKSTQTSSKALKWIFSILNILVLAIMVIGIFVGSNRFMVHEVNIQSKALPQSFDGFKIVQISDIHTGSWHDLKSFEKSVKLIQNLNPDMIVFTGDLVNSITDEAYRFEDLMASFNASYGKFAVLGNHDYGAYASWPSEEAKAQNLADLESFYERTGWKLLKNQSVAIVRGSDSIGLIGVENWGDNLRFPQYGNIDSAIYGMSEMPFFVLLSHDPSHWTKVVCEGYPQIDLTLSGHTHGFQFGITVGSFEWSPVQYLYPTWAGLYEKNGQFLNVNRGLGCLSYPGRIGIYPEITLVTLHTK